MPKHKPVATEKGDGMTIAAFDRRYYREDGVLYRRYQILIQLYHFVSVHKTVPSIRTLAKECQTPKGTLEAHLKRLKDEGLIEWIDGRLALPKTKWEPPGDFIDFVS